MICFFVSFMIFYLGLECRKGVPCPQCGPPPVTGPPAGVCCGGPVSGGWTGLSGSATLAVASLALVSSLD